MYNFALFFSLIIKTILYCIGLVRLYLYVINSGCFTSSSFFLPTGILLNKVLKTKKDLKEYSAYDSMRLCNKQNKEIAGLK